MRQPADCPDSVTTSRAIDQLEVDIERAKKANMLQARQAAECALDTALVVLRELNQRLADLETEIEL